MKFPPDREAKYVRVPSGYATQDRAPAIGSRPTWGA
jgi:hypothetical protein